MKSSRILLFFLSSLLITSGLMASDLPFFGDMNTPAALSEEAGRSSFHPALVALSLCAFGTGCGLLAWYLHKKMKKRPVPTSDSPDRVIAETGTRQQRMVIDALSVIAVASVGAAAVTGLSSNRRKTGLEKAKEDVNTLVAAIEKDDEKWIGRVLNPERSLELADARGQSVLHVAAQRGGDAGIARLAADERAIELFESSDFEGCTPLMLACKVGKFDTALSLLAHAGKGNVGVEKLSREGMSALHYLMAYDWEKDGLEPEDNLFVQQRMAEVASHLINKGCDPHASATTVAMAIAEDAVLVSPQPRAVAAFDEYVARLQAEYAAASAVERAAPLEAALAAAARRQRAEEAGDTPAGIAAAKGHEYLVEYLNWYSWVHPTKEERVPNGRTALMYAAFRGDSDVMRMLLAEGGDVAAMDMHDNTALHYAAGLDTGREREQEPDVVASREIVAMLLDAGCDPHRKNAHGETPIEIALRVGNRHLAAQMDVYTPPVQIAVDSSAGEGAAAQNYDSLFSLINRFFDKSWSGVDVAEKLIEVPDDGRDAQRDDKLRRKLKRKFPASSADAIEGLVKKRNLGCALRWYVESLAAPLTAEELRYRAQYLGRVASPPNPQPVPMNLLSQLTAAAERKNALYVSDVSSVSGDEADGDSAGGQDLVHSVELESAEGDSSITGFLPPPTHLVEASGVFHEPVT